METLSNHLHHLDKRLRFRFRIYFLISIALISVITYDVFTSKLSGTLGIFGVAAGVLAGIIFARMFRISWDQNAQKIVSSLDAYGITLLVLYILFEMKREWIVSHFVPAQVIGATSFAVLAGVMIGRFLGTRGKIIQVLKEQKVFI